MAALRVLHVDDEPDIRELVGISLALDPELVVKSCSSGGAAIAAAAEWSPDLILMDVMMPIMDGPATLAQLRKHDATASIPVVFMTARAQARELAHFLSLGAAGVIPKPFDPMTLARTVKQYLHTVVPGEADLALRFSVQAKRDAQTLASILAKIGAGEPAPFDHIEKIARALLVSGKACGSNGVVSASSALERMNEDASNGIGGVVEVKRCIERLIKAIAEEYGQSDTAQLNLQTA